MKKFFSKLSEIFEEGNGRLSNIRVIATILVVNSVIMGYFIMFSGLQSYIKGHETLMGIVGAVTTLITSITTVAATFKILQKKDEIKSNQKNQKDLN